MCPASARTLRPVMAGAGRGEEYKWTDHLRHQQSGAQLQHHPATYSILEHVHLLSCIMLHCESNNWWYKHKHKISNLFGICKELIRFKWLMVIIISIFDNYRLFNISLFGQKWYFCRKTEKFFVSLSRLTLCWDHYVNKLCLCVMAIDRPRPRGGPQHFQMANVGLNLSKMEMSKVLSNRM